MQTTITLRRAALAASTMLIAAAAADRAQAGEQIGDVFYIALENHNFTQPASYNGTQAIVGNPAAPFLNSLITAGNPNAQYTSYASNYTNVPPQSAGSPSGAGPVHPSEPNYVWAEAGLAGPRNDANPYPNNIVTAPNLSGQLQNAGIGWKVYAEDANLQSSGGQLTSTPVAPGQTTVPLTSFSGTSTLYTNPYNGSDQYNYAAKHVGQLFFTATNGGNDPSTANPEAAHYAPMQQLASDLSNNTVSRYSWITPDQYNDMHTPLTAGFTYNGITYTGDAASIAQGDNFLSIIVPMIEASAAWQNNGEIVIWNDETEGDASSGSTDGFTSTEIVISKLAKGNAYTNSINYTHSSDLLTDAAIFGQSCLGDACNATSLSDLYVDGALPEPGTLALLGGGLLGLAALRRRTSA